MIDFGWNDPLTLGTALSALIGWSVGKAAFSYFEYRQWKKRNND